MSEQVTWAPYKEKLQELLEQLQAQELDQHSALADLRAGSTAISCRTWRSEQAEKIALGTIKTAEQQLGLCMIYPAAGCDLPVYVSRWQETQKQIVFLVDLVPTVDTLVDEAYRVKYIEPMGQSWDRFASLAGIWPEEDDGVRAVCSIIYTAARMPIERQGQRLAALSPHTEYLKSYADYARQAGTVVEKAKQAEIERRVRAIKATLRINAVKLIGPMAPEHTEGLLELFF